VNAVRRRFKIILLFPVFIILFFVGWIPYVMGDRQTRGNTLPERESGIGRKEESTLNNDEVQMALIEEIAELP
jgi:hypothetical protein